MCMDPFLCSMPHLMCFVICSLLMCFRLMFFFQSILPPFAPDVCLYSLCRDDSFLSHSPSCLSYHRSSSSTVTSFVGDTLYKNDRFKHLHFHLLRVICETGEIACSALLCWKLCRPLALVLHVWSSRAVHDCAYAAS